MRVLSSVTDPRLGGPQRRSLDVAKRLKDHHVETIFLIPKGNDSFATTVMEAGFETHRIKLDRIRSPMNIRENLRFLGEFRSSTRSIRDIMQKTEADGVHANMAVNFQTARAAAGIEVPLAWHFNDTLTPPPVRQAAAIAGNRWADELVVAADAVHDYYFEADMPSRTIYAPVNVNQFDPDQVSVDKATLRKDLGLPPEVPIVGTVGNINPIKGHEYLLRAIAKLSEDGQELGVPIVGAPLNSRESYFERLQTVRSELGLENHVQFVGFRDNVPELLSLFDVFVLPSVAEACPIVVLEAMAMECPVVATRVGGVVEEIPDEDHGWLVPPKDIGAMADAIAAALDAPDERRRRAENARGRVESIFSLEACVDRHLELYRDLAAQP